MQDDWTEDRVQKEQLVCQVGPHLLSPLVKDVAAPHPQDFPSSKLMEEGLASDLLIVITLNEPICQSDVISWFVILIGGNTFPG